MFNPASCQFTNEGALHKIRTVNGKITVPPLSYLSQLFLTFIPCRNGAEVEDYIDIKSGKIVVAPGVMAVD